MLIWVKACQNRCVFSPFLKMSRVGESLMNFGNWFHKVGAECMKYHAAKVWYLTFGVCSFVPVLLDHILSHVLLFMLIRSCKYFGAISVMHLNVVIRILCSILCCMGSQCSFFSAHDELKYLFLFRIGCVQLFCMVWYFLWVLDDRL